MVSPLTAAGPALQQLPLAIAAPVTAPIAPPITAPVPTL
jgi:hypothetical protein